MSKSRKWLPCFQHPTKWTVNYKHWGTFSSETNLDINPLLKPSNCKVHGCVNHVEIGREQYRRIQQGPTSRTFHSCSVGVHHTSQVQHHETHGNPSQPQEKDFHERQRHPQLTTWLGQTQAWTGATAPLWCLHWILWGGAQTEVRGCLALHWARCKVTIANEQINRLPS